jgi:hypothetical protein
VHLTQHVRTEVLGLSVTVRYEGVSVSAGMRMMTLELAEKMVGSNPETAGHVLL